MRFECRLLACDLADRDWRKEQMGAMTRDEKGKRSNSAMSVAAAAPSFDFRYFFNTR